MGTELSLSVALPVIALVLVFAFPALVTWLPAQAFKPL